MDSYLQAPAPLFHLISVGGPVVWLLGFLSVFSTAIIFIKSWQFFTLRTEDSQNIERSLENWQRHEPALAMQALKESYPVQRIVLRAMTGIQNRENPAQLHRELVRQSNGLVHELRLYLKPLEIIASLSPLLGLMGTVIGMIIAFQQMEGATSQINPSLLSGGIWQALLTTAAGLAVAIPVAAAHGYFERKVERVSHLINDVVSRVFTVEFAANFAVSSTEPVERGENRFAD